MGMMAALGRWMANALSDSLMRRLLTEPYPESLFSMLPILNKVQMINFVETGMRAHKGKPISRPLGSPVILSEWHKILLNPVHLFRLPTPDQVQIETKTVIGPRAAKPLTTEIPILISGMSYGGALSLEMKVALARGAALAGTATNTGEAPLVPQERQAAKFLIGQYNRGGWLNNDDDLGQLDAIEIQLGQGAQASAPQRTLHWMTGPNYRQLYGLAEGEDAVIHSRLPGVDSVDDFIRLVRRLRETHGVPVGLKIAATHHLERELAIALKAGIDYFVVDGAEAGTHGGAPILQDDVGLPTLHALARTVRYLEEQGAKEDVSVIAAGGLVSPGHFLKALALGADAVYIGTLALVAALHTQINKALPAEPAPQVALYTGRFTEDLDQEAAAMDLFRYLQAAVKEMTLTVYSLGKQSLAEVNREDLCTTDPMLARVCRIDYAGFPPGEAQQLVSGNGLAGDGRRTPAGDGKARRKGRADAAQEPTVRVAMAESVGTAPDGGPATPPQ